MAIYSSGSHSSRVAPILGSIRSTGVPALAPHGSLAVEVLPFVTISREAGAGGVTLAKALVAKLNALDDGGRQWECFDRELIAKIAADHHISAELISSLEESSHNWLTDFFGNLTLRDDSAPSDIRVFHSAAATVRALAQAGRVVMVGMGAGFVTSNMPGGIHVRLVAELPFRISTMMRLLGVDEAMAVAEVKRRDEGRVEFFRRFFPGRPVLPEQFTMTLTASAMTEEQMVSAIVAVVKASGSS